MTTDESYLDEAIELARQAEREGNLPIGAVMVLDGVVIARGKNTILVPSYQPGRHAETELLRQVPVASWPDAAAMTCYTTLEPCVMCYGSLLLHGVGRIVFGACDPDGGASAILPYLPVFYARASVPAWHGPMLEERCGPFFLEARRRFEKLPVTQRGGHRL